MDNVSKLLTRERDVQLVAGDPEKNRRKILDLLEEERAFLEKSMSHTQDRIAKICDIDVDNVRFKSLIDLNQEKRISISDIFKKWDLATQPTQREKFIDDVWRRLSEKNDSLKLYIVINSKNNKIYTLAPDAEVARMIAWHANRISDIRNGRVREIGEDEIER